MQEAKSRVLRLTGKPHSRHNIIFLVRNDSTTMYPYRRTRSETSHTQLNPSGRYGKPNTAFGVTDVFA